MKYPETKRAEITEKMHDVEIKDPYRWLEDYSNPDVQKWVKNQHKFTEEIFKQIPNKELIYKRLKELLSIGELTAPVKSNDRIFFQKRTTENQFILFYQKETDSKPTILINPNKEKSEEPVALDWFFPSQTGKYVAYGLSKSGDEWSTLHIINTETMEILSEEIPRTRYSSVALLKNDKGFYYTRYPQVGSVPPGQENYNRHVYFHLIGTDWKQDPKVFGENRNPTEIYTVKLSEDENHLLLTVEKYTKNDHFLIDTKNYSKITKIIEGEDCLSQIYFYEKELWILTNRNAPNWQVCKTDIAQPSVNNWFTIIPESKDVLENIFVSKTKLIANFMHNAYNILKIFTKEGKEISIIDLPMMSSISEFDSENNRYPSKERLDLYFSLSNFLTPSTIYKYSIIDNKLTIFNQINSPLNQKDYIVKQVWYPSKDKTKVSMFLIYKKTIELNSKNQTILYGYGGFNIPMKPPTLDYSRFLWLENGGVIAIANLRGGSEYGEQWHRNGMLDKKQNVFDDFIYAAKWLIKNKYTSSENLAVICRSNGGLLTGAAVTQAPELFKAVFIGVPLLDMLRYHNFSIAKLWIPEYGCAENKDQFKFLYNYSPYHKVKKGTNYPATYLLTAESDSRVDPSHALKMTAMMQWASSSNEPIFLEVEQKAGHGVGKPLNKKIESQANLYAFLGWKTGLKFS